MKRLYEKCFEDFERACNKHNRLRQKEMIPLTYEENKSYKKQKVCSICKKK